MFDSQGRAAGQCAIIDHKIDSLSIRIPEVLQPNILVPLSTGKYPLSLFEGMYCKQNGHCFFPQTGRVKFTRLD